MAKYFMHWEVVTERLPNDPKEIAAGWKQLIGMVHKDLQQGSLTEWGAFPGDRTGYCIAEGNNVKVMQITTQYAPFIKFTVHPVASVDEVDDFLNSMLG